MDQPEWTVSDLDVELAANKRAIDAAEVAASCLGGTAREFATASGFRFSLSGLLDLIGGALAQEEHRRAAGEAQLRASQQALADLNRALGHTRFDVAIGVVGAELDAKMPYVDRRIDPDERRAAAEAWQRVTSAAAAASSRAMLRDVERVRQELVRRRSVLEAARARLA